MPMHKQVFVLHSNVTEVDPATVCLFLCERVRLRLFPVVRTSDIFDSLKHYCCCRSIADVCLSG